MGYIHYLHSSIQVFTACFFIGTIVNIIFHKITFSYFNNNIPLHLSRKERIILFVLAILQLITVITVTYLLHMYKIFHTVFETYTPHILFSTFLLSLQTTLLYNLQKSIGIHINNFT